MILRAEKAVERGDILFFDARKDRGIFAERRLKIFQLIIPYLGIAEILPHRVRQRVAVVRHVMRSVPRRRELIHLFVINLVIDDRSRDAVIFVIMFGKLQTLLEVRRIAIRNDDDMFLVHAPEGAQLLARHLQRAGQHRGAQAVRAYVLIVCVIFSLWDSGVIFSTEEGSLSNLMTPR